MTTENRPTELLTTDVTQSTAWTEISACVSDALFVHDGCGRIQAVNPAACRLLGYDRDTLLASTTRDIAGWIDGSGRAELARRNGRRVAVEMSSRTLDLGAATAVLTVVKDIDAIVRTENALREANLRLQTARRATSIGLWDWDLATNRVSYSPEWKAQLGYSEEEIADDFHEWHSRVHPDDLAGAVERIDAMVRNLQESASAEFRLRHKDGSYRWIFAQASLITDEAGHAVRVLGSHVDVTDGKQNQLKLAESEQRFRRLYEMLPVAYQSLNEQGRLIEVNDAWLEVLGYERSEVLGHGFSEFMVAESAALVPDQFSRFKASGHVETEFTMRHKDGSDVVFFFVGRVARDPEGRFVQTHCVAVDITEKRLLEEQLRQSQKMEAVGRLAAGVAHDFNNQLQVILGYGELLLDDWEIGDSAREMVALIRKAAVHSRETASHLLSFSRRQVLEPEPVDLGRFLREIEHPSARLIGEDVAFVVEVPDSLPPVRVDQTGLHQALMNLVINAKDAMPEGGRLTIRAAVVGEDTQWGMETPATAQDDYVLLEVLDTGTGMDETTLRRICEPFFTTKGPTKGSGLGMSMVQGFISQSGGHLHVASRPGEGTRVRILLPCAEQKDSLVSPDTDHRLETEARSAGTIMIVEDEDGVRSYLSTLLKRAGFEVYSASHPREAITMLEQGDLMPDLVVSDVTMPEMRGDQMAEKLKVTMPSLRFLFISGNASAGIDDQHFLRKPCDSRELLERVNVLLASDSAG